MKFVRRCASILLCLVLFLGSFYAVEDWRGARAWEATVQEVKEHGGATDFAVILAPPIPDDQNLAMAPFFVNALAYYIDPETKQLTLGKPKNDPRLDVPFATNMSGRTHPVAGNWKQGRSTDLSGWQSYFRGDPAFPQATDPQSPAQGVLMALSRYKQPLEEVATAAAARLQSRFPINWTASHLSLTIAPHLRLLRDLATVLSLRASAEVASGKQTDAAADIALGFRLSEMTYQSFQIEDFVRINIIGMMEQPIWDGLAAKNWDADQLKRLQALLSRQDTLTVYASAMHTEQALAVHAIDSLGMLPLINDSPSFDRLFCGLIRIAPKGWYEQNKSRIIHYEQKYVLGAVDPARRRVFPSIIATGNAEVHATHLSPYTLIYLASCVPSSVGYESTLVHEARAQVNCDQAAIACALERYFLDHHSYPSDLSALTPDYMSNLPTDIIDGAPMRYQRAPDGRYRLYSIGWNARDDGGQVAWTPSLRVDDEAGDWVWQYQPMHAPELMQH